MRFTVFLSLLLFPAAVLAQTPAAPKPVPAKPQAKPIDTLFAQLKAAQTEQEAESISGRIEKLFLQSGSPSIDLLMTRANAALAASDSGTAKKLVDVVNQVAPDYAEGWRILAGMQAAAGDDQSAMLSLGKAISLNPRHFPAMIQLAQMFESYDNKKGALKLYRDAAALNPHIPGIDFRIRGLAHAVEGQGI